MSEQKIDEIYRLNELAGEKILAKLRKMVECGVEGFDAIGYVRLLRLYESVTR